MNEIERFNGGLSSSSSWSQARAVSHVHRSGALSAVRIQTSAEVAVLKTAAVTYVAQRGMESAALLSQAEQQLVMTVPNSSARVAMIADTAAMAIAGIVSDTAWNLRRS